jgi:ribonucleoside-diphosphate reductase beta chain
MNLIGHNDDPEAVKPFVRVPEADVHSMVADAVAIEKEFILESLPCSLLGMNAVLMGEYLEFVADRLLVQLGYGRRYGRVECPFDFMESMSIERKTNFFEARVSEYRKPVAGAEPARAEDYNDF